MLAFDCGCHLLTIGLLMVVDHEARKSLRRAIASYMAGEIRSYELDDVVFECGKSRDTTVREISRLVYCLYDDMVEHPISVTSVGWGTLRRVLVFLDTELEFDPVADDATWPFADQRQWDSNQHRVNGLELPPYDPTIHNRQVLPWWDRIPSSVGFAVLLGLLIALFVVMMCLS